MHEAWKEKQIMSALNHMADSMLIQRSDGKTWESTDGGITWEPVEWQ